MLEEKIERDIKQLEEMVGGALGEMRKEVDERAEKLQIEIDEVGVGVGIVFVFFFF